MADVEAQIGRTAPEKAVRACISTVMAGYRTQDYQDPRAFVALAVGALEDVPQVVLLRMCSPKTGIVREAKWPPAIAELVDWCDRDLARIRDALGKACQQIERNRVAERRMQDALRKAQDQVRSDGAAAAEKAKREQEQQQRREAAQAEHKRGLAAQAERKRRQMIAGSMTQRLCAVALQAGGDLVDRVMTLTEDEQDEAVDMELRKAGSGYAHLCGKLGLPS